MTGDITDDGHAEESELESSGFLTGTVTDTDNDGIGNAQVTVVDASTGTTAGTVLTGSDGNYTVSVPDDTYDVRVDQPLFEPAETTGITVSSSTEQVNFVLQTRAYKTRGELTDQFGRGVVGRNDAESGDPVGVQGVVPNADGFGLSTPDDLRVGGDVESASGHSLTIGGSRALALTPAGTDQTASGVTYAIGGSAVGGYEGNTANALGATVAGGGSEPAADEFDIPIAGPNRVTDRYGTVGGGVLNRAGDAQSGTESAVNATVGGGFRNRATGRSTTVGGGRSNRASGPTSTIGGGSVNLTLGRGTTVAGGRSNEVRGRDATVGGGVRNSASGNYVTVAGGQENVARDREATVGGGNGNTAIGPGATVGGGSGNSAYGLDSTVGGGDRNRVSVSGTAGGAWATIAGGEENVALENGSSVGGGERNGALSGSATVGGGLDNRAGVSGVSDGTYATVPGGRSNVAEGDDSLAAGRGAKARSSGTFVWSDSVAPDFGSDQTGGGGSPTGSDTFHARATGGVRFVTGLDTSDDPNAGAYLDAGGSQWQAVSARAAKHDVRPADTRSILEGVADLNIARWEYDAQPGVEHVGPMAADFHDAFGLGDDPGSIGHVDADGVALAAIQALASRLADARETIAERAERTEDLEAENKALRERLADSRDRIDRLEGRLAAVEDRLDGDGPARE